MLVLILNNLPDGKWEATFTSCLLPRFFGHTARSCHSPRITRLPVRGVEKELVETKLLYSQKEERGGKTWVCSLAVKAVSWEKMLFSVQSAPRLFMNFVTQAHWNQCCTKCRWKSVGILTSGTNIQERYDLEFHIQMSHVVIMATSGAYQGLLNVFGDLQIGLCQTVNPFVNPSAADVNIYGQQRAEYWIQGLRSIQSQVSYGK